jgi:hypothetical protein
MKVKNLSSLVNLRKRRLARAWLTTDQNGAARNLALSNHLQDDACRSSGLGLGVVKRENYWNLPNRPYLEKSYGGQDCHRDQDL